MSKGKLYTIIVVHFVGVCLNYVAFPLLLTLPFYLYYLHPSVYSILIGLAISTPLISFLIRLSVTRDCPVTDCENKLRVKLGMKKIGGFIGHYFIKPLKRWRYRL